MATKFLPSALPSLANVRIDANAIVQATIRQLDAKDSAGAVLAEQYSSVVDQVIALNMPRDSKGFAAVRKMFSAMHSAKTISKERKEALKVVGTVPATIAELYLIGRKGSIPQYENSALKLWWHVEKNPDLTLGCAALRKLKLPVFGKNRKSGRVTKTDVPKFSKNRAGLGQCFAALSGIVGALKVGIDVTPTAKASLAAWFRENTLS